jgi:HD-GYP domain-containing protein (c-di-GMP phosphodiesterase class II)
MNSTQVLLSKIAALRQRLNEQIEQISSPNSDPVQSLERKVTEGSWQASMLDSAVRPITPERSEGTVLPPRLNARGSRLLRQARELLQALRRLADDPLVREPDDPLAVLNREIAALLDMILRSAQTFPQAPSAQARLCDGLEAILEAASERLGTLHAGLENRRRELARVDALSAILIGLASGNPGGFSSCLSLADALLDEARRGLPLRFFQAPAESAVRHIACHSLVTAQVLARLAATDPEWAGRAHEPVLAGLLHDVGMIQLPAEILAQPDPLNDDQRRLMENHTSHGAELLARYVPGKSWLAEAAAAHHERLDGTGYPAGLRDPELPPLVRLLAVCDVYAALCCPRPYRAPLDPRAALTDTVLLAEQGALDRFQAERLLDLSFYPVGSVVELADGAVGMVVATHPARADLLNPARPVLTLLTDGHGLPLPFPCQLDLARSPDRSVLRVLPAAERRKLLLHWFPELVPIGC